MRRRAKVDLNHKQIVVALRGIGCTVQSLAEIGSGCPDLLVGRNGKTYLIEVKSAGGGLTSDQVGWFAKWRGGRVCVATSVDEAIDCVGAKTNHGLREEAELGKD